MPKAPLEDVKKALPGDGPAFLDAIGRKERLLREGHAEGVKEGDPRIRAAGLLFAGMGFSGVSANLVKDAATRALDTPFSIVKHYQIPRHVTSRWHTLAISYSGQTEETLQVVEDARQRQTPVTAFTTGGALAPLADHVVRQPKGYQPRAVCAYTWFSVLGYLEASGILRDEVPVQAARDAVAEVDAACGPKVPVDENPAKRLALDLSDSIPQIYATPAFYGVGLHFRGMLNENAKKIAHVDLVPECNHNDLTGWAGDDVHRTRFSCVVVSHAEQNRQLQRRLEFMAERYQQWGVPWHRHVLRPVHSFAEHVVEQARAMQFFDYTSVYVAALRGVDPSEIREIKALKQHLKSPAEGSMQVPAPEPGTGDASTVAVEGASSSSSRSVGPVGVVGAGAPTGTGKGRAGGEPKGLARNLSRRRSARA